MTIVHKELPHPIPLYAYMRYKENYFFNIMDREKNIYGNVHFNNEPLFGRSRVTVELIIEGKEYSYKNFCPISPNFGTEHSLTNGAVTLDIQETPSGTLFRIRMDDEQLKLDLFVTDRFSTYDFHNCKYAAPDLPSLREVMTFGLNLPFEHLEQSVYYGGTISVADRSITLAQSVGYRDHSWGIRGDNTTAWHSWSVFNFPDRTFGIVTLATLSRPGLHAKEGYVADADGARALRAIDARPMGKADHADGLPLRMVYELEDVFGQNFSLEADIANRMAQVSLTPEADDNKMVWTVTENFCNIKDNGNGTAGIGLVELGFNNGVVDRFY